jgi:repressor LexA
MEKRQELSKRQKEILRFILSEVRKKGYPPSVREIGKAIGLSSSSTVHAHLSNLEKKGYLKRGQALPRAIEVLRPRPGATVPGYKRVSSVPLVGRIAAGEPVLAEENIEDYFPLPTDFVGEGPSFLLRVKGDSMIEAGIFDGDYVVVRKQPTVENGEIAAVLLEDEATVKRFYKEKDKIRLQPENPSMEPILTREALVLGKVIAVLRRL